MLSGFRGSELSDEIKGDEPTIWELYRGIERVEKAVHDMSANSVSAAVFAVEKQALHSRIDTLQAEQVNLKAHQLASDNAVSLYVKEQDAQRGRNRLFVYALLATPVVATVLNFVFSGGLRTLGN